MEDDVTGEIAWFRKLDRLFWLAWLGLAVMVAVAYWTAADPVASSAQLPPELAQCSKLIPDPAHMSTTGKILYWALLAMQISIYVILLAALHIVIHRFASGRLFVAETMATLRWLGIVLIVWPFVDLGASEFVGATLKTMNDLPVYAAGYTIDVAPIAIGLFLLTLQRVLERAIAIKSENDLTI